MWFLGPRQSLPCLECVWFESWWLDTALHSCLRTLTLLGNSTGHRKATSCCTSYFPETILFQNFLVDTVLSVTAFIPKSNTASHLRTRKKISRKGNLELGLSALRLFWYYLSLVQSVSPWFCLSSNPTKCTRRTVSLSLVLLLL